LWRLIVPNLARSNQTYSGCYPTGTCVKIVTEVGSPASVLVRVMVGWEVAAKVAIVWQCNQEPGSLERSPEPFKLLWSEWSCHVPTVDSSQFAHVWQIRSRGTAFAGVLFTGLRTARVWPCDGFDDLLPILLHSLSDLVSGRP